MHTISRLTLLSPCSDPLCAICSGSGILAMFAAKAGASKVYAVEATNMAVAARKLIEANKVSNTL